jgi:oxygen-independent coproporphyrinogen-3 oxidase
MLLSQDILPGVGGIMRSARDQELGAIINGLLCQGEAKIGSDRALAMHDALAPFMARGLVELEAGVLSIQPGGLPYVRTIAALFDPYRQASTTRFSSAV